MRQKGVDSYILYIEDVHVTRKFCVHSVIYAYIIEVHITIAFNDFSNFLDQKVIRSGIRKYYERLAWNRFTVP